MKSMLVVYSHNSGDKLIDYNKYSAYAINLYNTPNDDISDNELSKLISANILDKGHSLDKVSIKTIVFQENEYDILKNLSDDELLMEANNLLYPIQYKIFICKNYSLNMDQSSKDIAIYSKSIFHMQIIKITHKIVTKDIISSINNRVSRTYKNILDQLYKSGYELHIEVDSDDIDKFNSLCLTKT